MTVDLDQSKNRARATLMVWLAGQESEYATIVVPTPVFVPDDRLIDLLREGMADPSAIELQFFVAPAGSVNQWVGEKVDLEDSLSDGSTPAASGMFTEVAPTPKRLLSDTEIYELVDHMEADGGIEHFSTSREAVFKLAVGAIEREHAAMRGQQ